MCSRQDTRLLVTHDLGRGNLSYAADGSRAPFVPLGVNRCAGWAPSQAGGWCDIQDGSLSRTARDTSTTWMATGYIPSADRESLQLYYAGTPFTHAGGVDPRHSWAANTGIGLLTLRVDGAFGAAIGTESRACLNRKRRSLTGRWCRKLQTCHRPRPAGFVALEAPYDFSQPRPSFTSTAVEVPAGCPRGAELLVNMVTGVAGYVAVAVEAADGKPPLLGFGLEQARPPPRQLRRPRPCARPSLEARGSGHAEGWTRANHGP
jgi:hypothetical protein